MFASLTGSTSPATDRPEPPPERKWNVIPLQRTPEQQQVVDEVKQIIADELRPHEKDDEAMIARFCRARVYNVEHTLIMLREYLRWREEIKPELMQFSNDMEKYLKYQTFYMLPKPDKFGRSILVLLPRNHNPYLPTQNIALQTFYWTVNEAIKRMIAPVENYVCITDLTGYGIRNNDMGLAKEQSQVLQNYYPERMGVTFVVNAPWYLSTVWKIIQGWLEERTKRKIQFLGSDYQSILLQVIDQDVLPDFLGGTYKHPAQEFDQFASNHQEEFEALGFTKT